MSLACIRGGKEYWCVAAARVDEQQKVVTLLQILQVDVRGEVRISTASDRIETRELP